jgi:hypothetical protein
MKVGAEPKKVAILGGLALVLGYLVYDNLFSSSVPQQSATPRPAASPPPAVTKQQPVVERRRPNEPQPVSTPRRPRTGGRAGLQEFRPMLRARRPEDRPDPMTIDPALKLDLLARVAAVKLEGGDRSLFEFSQAPPPKAAEVKIVPGPVKPVKPEPEKASSEPEKPVEPAKPKPPPINLKFYGYSNAVRQGVKRAFFLDGDDILVAGEGELIKRRYKVVRIGANSALVEDVEHKHEQTLPLEPAPAGT